MLYSLSYAVACSSLCAVIMYLQLMLCGLYSSCSGVGFFTSLQVPSCTIKLRLFCYSSRPLFFSQPHPSFPSPFPFLPIFSQFPAHPLPAFTDSRWTTPIIHFYGCSTELHHSCCSSQNWFFFFLL